jgi:hypothetical protein
MRSQRNSRSLVYQAQCAESAAARISATIRVKSMLWCYSSVCRWCGHLSPQGNNPRATIVATRFEQQVGIWLRQKRGLIAQRMTGMATRSSSSFYVMQWQRSQDDRETVGPEATTQVGQVLTASNWKFPPNTYCSAERGPLYLHGVTPSVEPEALYGSLPHGPSV